MKRLKLFDLCFILIVFAVCGLGGEIRDSNDSMPIQSFFRDDDDTIKSIFNEIQMLKASHEVLKAHLIASNEILKALFDSQQERLEDQFTKLNQVYAKLNALMDSSKTVEARSGTISLPSNCAGVPIDAMNSGIHKIKVESYGPEPFDVFCDFEIKGGNWTVIQRRIDGSENFSRNWADYNRGFGVLTGEFFIGLDKLHALTTESEHELLIVMRDFDGNEKYAKYEEFAITDESQGYALNVLGSYSGDAGDSLGYHKFQKFSTIDRDNDSDGSRHCAKLFKGGWWYNECLKSNLNGPYVEGGKTSSEEMIDWVTWTKFDFSLKFVEMLIRPKSTPSSTS